MKNTVLKSTVNQTNVNTKRLHTNQFVYTHTSQLLASFKQQNQRFFQHEKSNNNKYGTATAVMTAFMMIAVHRQYSHSTTTYNTITHQHVIPDVDIYIDMVILLMVF